MTIQTIFQSRLLFVSGKGGVGKTSFASALAKTSAEQGKKVLLVEIDNIHPSLTSIFGSKPQYEPSKVGKNLYIANLTWKEALEDWLIDTIKIRSIANRILSNKVAMIFLDATPGARELVILAKLHAISSQWDQIIVDLPASGHALGILRVPQTAQKLMKTGPIQDISANILEMFSLDTTQVVLVSLPEEMVINETIEFSQKISQEVPYLKNPVVILNRSSTPSFTSDEVEVVQRLQEAVKEERSKELIQAAIWEKDLERASAQAISRLQEQQGPDLISFPRLGLLGGYDGGPQKVVQQMQSALLRRSLQK